MRYPEAAACRSSVKKRCYWIFTKFTGKHLCQSLFFNKENLFKKRLWHRCFPVNFVKLLIRTFFTEHLWWLLLNKRNICIYDTALPIKSCRLILLKVHLEPCRTSTMKLLEKIDNGYKSLTILAKSFILDIWKSSEYVSGSLTWEVPIFQRYLLKKHQYQLSISIFWEPESKTLSAKQMRMLRFCKWWQTSIVFC